MAQQISEVMTADPVYVSPRTPVAEIAQLMREEDIGQVIIAEEERVRGVVTDRDLVTRVMADARDPQQTAAQEVSSSNLVTCAPDDDIGAAVRLMRDNALRRLPVVEEDRLVGVVSIGDLAMEQDERSALADISAAEPNR
ncbi:oxidoreductase [Streptomyces sulfonofaciens]|uniref:Oxidoreductase n=1 Tax=Streptomyces sulfonofaciens TaxID=68272 RepID=A0A919KWC9_9ACTN|nr:CBS domain-containing protein [Streptomyces sulfonofaciens]GHH75805.1 oxidoreductase [Streptomyces sulfonofaciens]